ncbi:MAG: gamma-glutamylcyclotransferase [Pseudomonadales bacterium]|nr:gamma-glutamylcyclotransferase [Pseudomonadales bacterium]
MDHFNDQDTLWLFGYGSLIYKADFPYLEKRPASIKNWARRFWQGSHDHRGTPENPGRVVTLIQESEMICHGMAYRITPDELRHLDYREKNGYLRCVTEIAFEGGDSLEGLIYIADHDNAAFLGELPEEAIARQISRASGPSGSNTDYVIELANALRSMNKIDDHVFLIEKYLLE